MNKSLKVLLVDDEPPARRWLNILLAAHPNVTVVGEAATVADALRIWKTEKPDVIFLDVQMPPENGFDLLPHLQPTPAIVFVTAHDTYAVRAFETNALDYLLKPVRPERLAETLLRLTASSLVPPASPKLPCNTLEMDDFLPLRDGGLQRIVQVREIALIEAEGAYTKVSLRDETTMIVLRRLREWEAILPSPPFWRIDRSTMVNVSLVRRLQRFNRDETHVELAGAGTHTLHRLAAQRLKEILRA